MKYLFIETIFNSPHLETSAEIALDLKDKKKKVYFSWIGYDLPWSDWILSKNKRIFGASIKKKINLIENILTYKKIVLLKPDDIPYENLKKISDWSNKFNGNLNNLKKYSYKGQKIGLGVSSSLISFFHESNLNIKKHEKTVKNSLISSAIVYERSLDLIRKIRPNYLVTFNNRFATSLPIILAAKKSNIKILRHERGSNVNKYEIFEKDIHDLDYRADIVQKYWRKEKHLEKKIKLAKKYFKNRRNGIPLTWDNKKNYALNQILGNVPKKNNKTRIIFYTASEDEHESTKFQLSNLLWPNQELALKKLISCLRPIKNYELFIRVHPVSEKRKSINDQIKWEKYKNYKNIKVVSFNSPINSYELLDTADLVVTYGGNIGIEALYWGKKVITLRNAIYSKHKIIFEPKNANELKKYINNFKNITKITKKNKFQVMKFAYYFMTFGKKFRFFKCNELDQCYYKKKPISHLPQFFFKMKKYSKKFKKL